MHSSYSKKPPGILKDSSSPQEYTNSAGRDNLNIAVSANLTENLLRPTQEWLTKITADSVFASRTLTHLTMLLVAVLVISLSNLELSWGTISAVRPLKYNPAEPTAPAQVEAPGLPLTLPAELNDTQDDLLVRAAVPRTIIPDRSQPVQNAAEIRAYTVTPGDTISGIAAKFGLNPETIIWSNADLEENPDLLSVGQELTILPVDGVYHQVGGGDTIEGIAGTYKTGSQAIIDHPLNQLDPENPVIQAGQWLVVPGGSKPFVPRTVTAYSGPVPDDAAAGSGIFGWPASGSISNGFFSYHPGLDIAAWTGAPVLAADSGYVLVSGWDNLYGYHLVIDHSNGFQTLYAHMQTLYVEAGSNVSKGAQIGEMGSTGNSTGPHLHFEIRHGTVQRNPYGFLP